MVSDVIHTINIISFEVTGAINWRYNYGVEERTMIDLFASLNIFAW